MLEKLVNLIAFRKEKVNSSCLSKKTYVSTDNMISNFGGISLATSIPKGKVTSFCKNDILLSNIRPYFKKTWFANISGGCSTDILVLTANEKIIPRYLYYSLCTDNFVNYYVSSCKGTKMPRGNKDALLDWKINLLSKPEQQHIVGAIGSVDELLENLRRQNEELFRIGITKINEANDNNELLFLHNICSFEKGYEVGSANYLNSKTFDTILYLRVGDLISLGETYVRRNHKLKEAHEDSILVAFDGAPGRNTIGLNGAFSSGIYNLKGLKENKGLTYFEINSELNKKIISNHSQGTTILHASSSIRLLKYANVSTMKKEELNSLFYLIIENKRKINHLFKIKKTLLEKYF